MTFPTEHRTNIKTVGDSGIKHPIYVFQISLDRLKDEKFGPKTNSRTVNVLHPAMSNKSADYGRTLLSGHDSVSKHSWLPGFLTGQNIDINDDGTITAYGQQASYLKKNYVDVENPILTIVNNPPYTSTSLTQVVSILSRGGIKAAGAAVESFTDI